MALLSLFVLALIFAPGLCDPVRTVDSVEFAKKQIDISLLYYHAREPNHVSKCITISASWSIENNINHYKNETAVKIWIEMKKQNWLLPLSVPFSPLNPSHQFEAITLFNILYSAKDYDTFYKTTVYMKDRVNQDLFIYVLSILHIHRSDLEGYAIPPIYEVLPEYFNNGEIMTTAQRIGVHGSHMIEYYPSTYKWDNSVVIRWNTTVWPYQCQSTPMSYYLHDYSLNAHYYYHHLTYSKWLGGDVIPLLKERRGEWYWFVHKQLVTRYYMERLSNGFGEIDELSGDVVNEGYNFGYMYHNGIPYPVRPNHFHLDHPEHIGEIEKIKNYERRLRDAIESGYIINSAGDHVDISSPEAIDILGRLIEAGVDSPNVHYYKDFISSWKYVLGNSLWYRHNYNNPGSATPVLIPSALEHYQTALSDPAFYMIWKRVLKLFSLWHHRLPQYKNEELALTDVTIEKVEVDKMVTYHEYTYTNISAAIHMNEVQSQLMYDKESVLVQYARLNHKKFNIRVQVSSKVTKKVEVKFFLAPKYDSRGFEIPLHANSENFFLLNHFVHELTAGENVIVRESTQNSFTVDDLESAYEIYMKAQNIVEGKKETLKERTKHLDFFPHHLLIPKGRVGGMPFVLMVYISELHPSKVSSEDKYGARFLSGTPLGFPVDRPLHWWQIQNLQNIYFHDVMIHHKPTPEIVVPYNF
uniref:Riboflavin binding hexamerin n=1 Tax=Hyalophora cecropia TaxID=7123 RepID=O17479_HYACE|nr:riboflavin binding hexamerin precursor [Hyalophora cecropia]